MEVCKIVDWKTERGFGFVVVGGRRAFLHAYDVYPQPEKGENLKGIEVFVVETEEGKKGFAVTRAETLEWHAKQEARRLEEIRRKDAKEIEEKLFLEGANSFLKEKSPEIWAMIEKDPLQEAWDKAMVRGEKYLLRPEVCVRAIRGISGEGPDLIAEIEATVTIRVESRASRDSYISGSEKCVRIFILEKQGEKWANMLPLEDSVRIAEYARRRRVDLADASKALDHVGATHLVSAIEVVEGYHGHTDHHSYLETVKRLADGKVALAIKSFAERNGVSAGKEVAWQGEWSSHEDSGAGMHGGDYTSGTEWVWAPWAQEVIGRVGFEIDKISEVATGVISEFHAAAVAEDYALLKKEWKNWHSRFSERLKTAEGKLRLERILAASKKAQALNKMRQAGVLLREAMKVTADETAQDRLIDIARVRKNWRSLNSQSFRARSARNGGFAGLHPDAQQLLRRILAAAEKASGIKASRAGQNWEQVATVRRQEAEAAAKKRDEVVKAEEKAKKQEAARFLTGNAWSALDKLKK